MDETGMNSEVLIKDGGARSQVKINRFEQKGGMLADGLRERGGGSGGNSELERISLGELFRTMQTTTSGTELSQLRNEKARRWQEVSDKLGDNLKQVREGIESVEKTIEAGQKPETGSDAPEIAKRIADSSGLNNDQQTMLETVIKDEVRVKFLYSSKAPDHLKDNLDSQDKRLRVTDISGIPVAESKSSGRGGRGVMIGEENKEEEGKKETEEDREAKSTVDYFRIGKERASLQNLGNEGFIKAYDEMLENPDNLVKRNEVAERINRASALGLNRVISAEVVEEILEMPEGDRGSDVKLTERLVQARDETEKAVQEHLRDMVKEGQIKPEEAQKLVGYGKLEMTRLAARLKAEDPLYPEPQVFQTTKPMEKEAGFKWRDVRNYVTDEEKKREEEEVGGVSKEDKFDHFLRRVLGLEAAELGAEVLEPFVEAQLKKFLKGRKETRQGKKETERVEKPKEKEEEKPKEAPKPEEAEIKPGNFQEAYDFIKQNWRSYDVLRAEEKAKFDEALRVKNASVEATSRHGNNEYDPDKGMFDGAKQGVRAVMSRLVGDDNYWVEVQTSGLPRQDMISKMARDLEPIRKATPDGQGVAEGIRDAWFEGVVRQWRLAELRAEDKRGIPGNRRDRIDELEREQRFLGWGSVSTPETLLLLDQLADRAVSWRIQNDPALKSWADAESEKNKPGENQAEQVLSPEEMVKRIRQELRVTETSLFQSADVMQRINNLKAIANHENVDPALREEIMDRLSVWMAGSEVVQGKAAPKDIIGKVSSLRQVFGLAVNEMVVERILKLDSRGIKVSQAWNLLQEVHDPGKYEKRCRELGIIRGQDKVTSITGNLYGENPTNQAIIKKWMLNQIAGDNTSQEQKELAADALRIAENLAKATGETSVWNKAAKIGEDKMAKWMYMKQWKIDGGIRKRGPDVIKASLDGFGTSWIRDSMEVENNRILSAEEILGGNGGGVDNISKLRKNGFETYWVKVTRQDAAFDLLTKMTWEKKELKKRT